MRPKKNPMPSDVALGGIECKHLPLQNFCSVSVMLSLIYAEDKIEIKIMTNKIEIH